MFKRLRTIKGDTLNIIMKRPEDFRRVVRAQVTKGSGTPIARLTYAQTKDNELIVSLNANESARMLGTYRYEIAIETALGVKTMQHGILEVL